MVAADMPEAEVDLDTALVERLVASQFPHLGGLPVRELAYGWDNVVFRLGADLVVRLPRRAAGAELVEREQRWLPHLAPSLPLPIPAPVHCGVPDGDYPWRWSICRWLPGDIAARTPPTDGAAAARTLGGFVRALHVPAPADAPPNPSRGVPLRSRDDVTQRWLGQLPDDLAGHLPRLRHEWAEVLDLPDWSGPPVWLHGDLHPANLLVHEARLHAVIDFGDLTAGDPATDLAVGWMLFSPLDRQAFRAMTTWPDDEELWARARAWALALAIACLANSADHPVIAGLGRRTLAAVLGGPQA